MSSLLPFFRFPPLFSFFNFLFFSLFGYVGSTGDICFNQKKSEYCVDKCPCGIFCRFVHSKNEYNYHPDHFRKEFRCTREKNKFNKCIYLRTCYGKHPEEELFKISGYKKAEINSCLNLLINALVKMDEPNNKFISIKKKYALDKYMKVSNERYLIETD